jgi:hypothetical protein
MSRCSPHTGRTAVRRLLAVTLCAFPLVACQSEAQGSASTAAASAPAARRGEPYRLTADVINKVSAIMTEWDPQGPPFLNAGHSYDKWKTGTQLINDLVRDARAGRTTLIDSTPALKAAIARAGLSPRDFSAAFDAYIIAQDRIRGDEMLKTEEEKRRYGYPPATGVTKENLELMRTVDPQGKLWSII